MGMVLLDSQKALDNFDHHISCNKLKLMGVTSTKWVESYLGNRTQLVNIGKIYPDSAAVTCGVPQGSIFGAFVILVLCQRHDN